MDTHFDREHRPNLADEWMDSLMAKAEKMRAAQQSQITGGKPEEPVLNEWKRKGIHVRELPPDEHGILRISIGGGPDTPTAVDYCVFRGSHGKCVDLLRRALIAMQEGPQDAN